MRRRPLRRGPSPQEPSALPAPSPAPCWSDQIARPNVGALQGVVGPMATLLGVSPGRILLLFGETGLSPTATPRTLQLGAAASLAGERPEAAEASRLQLRLQGKEKHQALRGPLSRDSPLKTLMTLRPQALLLL